MSIDPDFETLNNHQLEVYSTEREYGTIGLNGENVEFTDNYSFDSTETKKDLNKFGEEFKKTHKIASFSDTNEGSFFIEKDCNNGKMSGYFTGNLDVTTLKTVTQKIKDVKKEECTNGQTSIVK